MGFGLNNSENQFRIESITDSEQWNNYLLEFEDANIYQTWNFPRYAQRQKNLSHICIFQKSELISLALVKIRTAPFLNKGIAYVYRGPLWQKKGAINSIKTFNNIVNLLIDEFLIKRNYLLRIKPCIFSDQIFYSDRLLSGFSISPKIHDIEKTLVMDLSEDLSIIKSKFSSKWRNRLNQALKNEMIVKSGFDNYLFQTYLELYKDLQKRKHFKEYVNPARMMEMNLKQDYKFKLKAFIAFKNETALSSLIVSAIGNTGIYLLGATNNEGMKYKASYLLQWEAIQWLKSQGITRYDLGGIDREKNPGVYEFKSGITKNEVSDLGSLDFCNSKSLEWIVQLGEFFNFNKYTKR